MGKSLPITLAVIALVNGALMPRGPLTTFIGWACIFGCSLFAGWASCKKGDR